MAGIQEQIERLSELESIQQEWQWQAEASDEVCMEERGVGLLGLGAAQGLVRGCVCVWGGGCRRLGRGRWAWPLHMASG